MALDPVSVGAAMILTDGAASKATAAAAAANSAASSANSAAGAANTAAQKAAAYAGEYAAVDADVRLLYSQFQAQARYLEKRITTLENQVAALAGK